MSALGQQQPVSIIAGEWLLSARSGRSDQSISAAIRASNFSVSSSRTFDSSRVDYFENVKSKQLFAGSIECVALHYWRYHGSDRVFAPYTYQSGEPAYSPSLLE